jgi:hypothetical protein
MPLSVRVSPNTPNKKITMKAYSYLQLSTPTQRMPIAITRQIERTKQYCDGHGMTLEDFEINGLSAFKDSQKKENVLSGFRKSIESGSHLMPCALIVDDTKWITGQDFRVIFQEFTELIRLNVELHTTHDRMVYRAKDFDVFGLVLNIGRVLGRNELSQAMSMRRRKGLK